MNFRHWRATQILTVGFAGMILIGAILLSLPISSRSGVGVPFLNALFTSTSASCVTGLVVYDTWTQFTFMGQLVILLLIQIGGLGFMAVAILFSLAVGRRIGLRERSLLMESVSALQLGGVVRLVRRTLIGTALIEGSGAVLLAFRFIPRFGFWRGCWFSIFHSVSAFCNAGFDLMGVSKPFSSLTEYYDDPLVVLTISALIVIGGIGFVVWNDLVESKFRFKKFNLHTRAVLVGTLALIVGGTLLFLLLEENSVMAGMNLKQRILAALFQSVTPRTAGFNTVDIASLTDGSKFVTMLLMFVGAAPGGTGGGVKITTLVVVAAAVTAFIKNQEDISISKFRLERDTLFRAFCGMVSYVTLAIFGVLVLCAQGSSLTASAFECLSAIGTVGLTTGITPTLPTMSHIMLIILMYAGRIGSLTVFLAVSEGSSKRKLKDPVAKIIVG